MTTVVALRLIAAGDDTDKAGPLGLLVLVLLGIACYFLFRSMSKHLRRVDGVFQDESSTAAATDSAAPEPAPTPASIPPEPGGPPTG